MVLAEVPRMGLLIGSGEPSLESSAEGSGVGETFVFINDESD